MNDGYRNLPAINQGGVFGTPSTILPVDAVEEFPVLSGVEAEYGRNAGAIVNIVTRSGSNELHGSVFEYFRDDALGARNFFNQAPRAQERVPQPPVRRVARRPDREGQDLLLRRLRGPARGRRPAGRSRACRPRPSSRARSRRPAALNPVIAAPARAQPLADAEPAGGRGGQQPHRHHALREPRRQPDRQDRPPLGPGATCSPRATSAATATRASRSRCVGGGVLPGLQHGHADERAARSRPRTRRSSRRACCSSCAAATTASTRRSSRRTRTSTRRRSASTPRATRENFGLPHDHAWATTRSIGANTSLPRGRVDTNWQLFGNVSYNPGRHKLKFGYEFRRTHRRRLLQRRLPRAARLRLARRISSRASRAAAGRRAATRAACTAQNNHAFYLQDSFQASRTPHVQPRPALGLLRRHRRGATTASAAS